MNTKNEEHESQYRALADSYEREMEHVVTESNRIINQQKDALERFNKLGNPQEMIQELKQTYEG